jgi:hypothetical protein
LAVVRKLVALRIESVRQRHCLHSDTSHAARSFTTAAYALQSWSCCGPRAGSAESVVTRAACDTSCVPSTLADLY